MVSLSRMPEVCIVVRAAWAWEEFEIPAVDQLYCKEADRAAARSRKFPIDPHLTNAVISSAFPLHISVIMRECDEGYDDEGVRDVDSSNAWR